MIAKNSTNDDNGEANASIKICTNDANALTTKISKCRGRMVMKSDCSGILVCCRCTRVRINQSKNLKNALLFQGFVDFFLLQTRWIMLYASTYKTYIEFFRYVADFFFQWFFVYQYRQCVLTCVTTAAAKKCDFLKLFKKAQMEHINMKRSNRQSNSEKKTQDTNWIIEESAPNAQRNSNKIHICHTRKVFWRCSDYKYFFLSLISTQFQGFDNKPTNRIPNSTSRFKILFLYQENSIFGCCFFFQFLYMQNEPPKQKFVFYDPFESFKLLEIIIIIISTLVVLIGVLLCLFAATNSSNN